MFRKRLMTHLLVGVAGLNASGKSSVCNHLRDAHGFTVLSLSDAIRDELKSRSLETTRENLLATGNELRNAHGAGVLAERTLAKLRLLMAANTSGAPLRFCIDSIRHPGEVAALRQFDGTFRLVAVSCDAAVRFARLQERGRAGDCATLEDFQRIERAELANPDPLGQQVSLVQQLADIQLNNDSDIDTLLKALDAALAL
jgi:dephospho-CoA kinase